MWDECSEMRERGRGRMDERNMEQEEQSGKRKGWGIERKMFFFGIVIFILDKTVIRNSKTGRANIAYYTISDESA
jgi:hypothetical protein